MQLTSRERVEAALNHREPDRTPVFEYVLLSPVADHLLGRRYAADPANWSDFVDRLGWEGAVRQNAVDRLDLALFLCHDMLYVTPNALPPVDPSVADTSTIADNDAGAPPLDHAQADASPSPDREIAPTDDPVDRVKRRNQFRAQSMAPPPDDSLLVYVYLQEEMRRCEVDLPILAPAYEHGIWTDVDLMETMLLAPDVASEHFSLATRQALGAIERYIALGIDQIGIGGDFAGTRLMISPQDYREFIMPEVRSLARRIHRAGCWAINATDGDLWPVIDDFLIGCEVDGYLEIDLHAGMDLRRLKSLYGDRITLYGNLDCGNTLSMASPDEVRRHTIDCLEAGMGNGGHILCASNAIVASVPLCNYLAVVNAYREAFSLPDLAFPPQASS